MRSLGRLGTIATVFAAAVVAGSIISRVTTSRHMAPQPIAGDFEQLAEMSGASRVPDIRAAASAANHVVFSADVAVGRPPTSIWVNDIGQVIEVYGDELEVISEIPGYGPDPLAYYRAVIEDAARDSVYLTSVQGIPGLAVEPNTDQLGTNPGLIRFELRGVSVVVTGRDMPVERLLSIAEQLSPVPPPARG
ncbi:MAG TPA: hypothetical protein VNP94_11530 [Actinomycetota bacterium]|nr:hypothetical protein [Actinomycetota bacterium]